VDKDLFYQKTMPAILAQMQARRAEMVAQITTGLGRSTTAYPLSQAIVDLGAYENAGSIPGAINGIVTDAGKKTADAEMSVKFNRDANFVLGLETAELVQTRLTMLSPAQALAVANAMEAHLAMRGTSIKTYVSTIDPANSRLRDGPIAKGVLPLWQIRDDRDAASIKQWSDAIDAATK
jgi:hypothetical protein